jgi:hypothetical protein
MQGALLNGSDTSNVLKLKNAGTGKTLVVTDGSNNTKFSVAQNGTIVDTPLATSTPQMITTTDGAGTFSEAPLSWEFLGSSFLSSAASNIPAITIAAREELLICVRVTGYGGSDTASLRFNADSGNNYWWRYLTASTDASATLTNNEATSTNIARLFGTNITTGRSNCAFVTNSSTSVKIGTVDGQSGTTDATTGGVPQFGGFQYSTTTKITSVQLLTAGGANMNASTGLMIFGRNF